MTVFLVIALMGLAAALTPGNRLEGQSASPQELSADFASSARGILHVLYPELRSPVRMRILDDRDWDDRRPMDIFTVELCDISKEQMLAEEPCPCASPVLKATVTFDIFSGDHHLHGMRMTGPVPRGRQDKFEKLIEKYPDWSTAQVVEALKEAGAKFGPDQKEQVIKTLPLGGLRPYMGDLKVESARFVLKDARDWKQLAIALGGAFWVVHITATLPSGGTYYYWFAIEPFEGKVMSILRVFDPYSPDFPSFPPNPEIPKGVGSAPSR
jgi:hypothetical protein